MATPTTTIETVRNALEASMSALSPVAGSGAGYELTRGDEPDFRAWAEANPAAALRRYSFYRVGEHAAAENRTLRYDEFGATLEMVVAYPHHFGLYEGGGVENYQDLRDMIEEDANQILRTVGRYGHGNWPSGSWPVSDTYEVERGDGVTFLVVRVPFAYYRDIIPGPTTWSITATSALSLTSSATMTLVEGGPGIPASYGDIATSNDPMQSLINGLENSVSPTIAKPDYMWCCNQTSGAAIEVGGSGFDLDQNTGVDVNQTPTVLSGANVCVFDASTDILSNNSDGALQLSTGSYFALCVVGLHTISANGRIMGDKDGADEGWLVVVDSSNNLDAQLEDDLTNLGNCNNLSGEATNNALMVVGYQVDQTAVTATLMANDGTPVTNPDISNLVGSLSSSAQTLGFGDVGNGSSNNFEAGILAIWKGAAAEAITSTMVANLFASLGGT